MWPFKKRSKVDEAMKIADEAINVCKEQWVVFANKIPFKEDVSIQERITAFSMPMIEGLRNAYLELKDAPDELLFLYTVMGVDRAGTFRTEEIENALGLEIPEM